MKKSSLVKCALIMSVIPFSGCITLENENYEQQMAMQRMRNENRKQAQKVAELSREMEQREALVQNFLATMAANSQRIETLERQLLNLEKSMGRNTKALEERLAAEKALREKANNALINQVSKELETVATDINKRLKDINTSTGSGYGVYTVRRGDTLSQIAKAAGITVSKLKKVNGLSSNIIRVGQDLKIPVSQ